MKMRALFSANDSKTPTFPSKVSNYEVIKAKSNIIPQNAPETAKTVKGPQFIPTWKPSGEAISKNSIMAAKTVSKNESKLDKISPPPSVSEPDSIIDTGKQAAQSYEVTFKVNYETEPGQEMYVVGGHSSLGNWKEMKAKMEWTEGHNWVLTEKFDQPFVSYKYVVVRDGVAERYEEGINRIADF